jgi:hypothetical protein
VCSVLDLDPDTIRSVAVVCSVLDPDPDSIGSVDPYPESESGSESRRAKMQCCGTVTIFYGSGSDF